MALVIGLVTIIQSVYEALTDCRGSIMWFGILSFRLLALYIAEMPWSNVFSDFHCDIDASAFCRRACFKAYFDSPILSIWTITYVLFIISVLIMERLASQLHCNLTKTKMKKGALIKNTRHATLTGVKRHFLAQKDIMIDLHQQKMMLVLYLVYLILRLHIEIAFLYILVIGHLPTMEETPIVCSTRLCPGPYDCILLTTVEKRVLVFLLFSISAVVICSCIVLGFYAICRYVFVGHSHNENPNWIGCPGAYPQQERALNLHHQIYKAKAL